MVTHSGYKNIMNFRLSFKEFLFQFDHLLRNLGHSLSQFFSFQHGTTQASELVNLQSFFTGNILPELQTKDGEFCLPFIPEGGSVKMNIKFPL